MDQPREPAASSAVLMARLREMRDLSPTQLDALPFGVIKVDRSGVIVAYNASEARLADRKAADVIGRNFFTEVAPCTNVAEFAARFHRGIQLGALRDVFPFVFSFPAGPVLVSVTLLYESGSTDAWILVDRARAATEG